MYRPATRVAMAAAIFGARAGQGSPRATLRKMATMSSGTAKRIVATSMAMTPQKSPRPSHGFHHEASCVFTANQRQK